MNLFLKRRLFFFAIFFAFFFRQFCFAQIKFESRQDAREFALENGMRIFLLENSSDALIRANFIIKAGFSSQSQENNGFFKLLPRIIRASNPKIDFLQAECLSDATTFSFEIAPQQTQKVFSDLSEAVFAQNFSNEILQSELAKLKKEVETNSKELSVLINAAVDSRVFSDSPWKHDSGIYPALFSKISTENAKILLSDIANRFYVPQNSAIFITGNFNSEKILSELNQTFGKYYSNYKTPDSKPCLPTNKQRKFVFHHSEISPELTQIVVQYATLNLEECEILAALLNNNYSAFKNQILEQKTLNIPGPEYIDASAAHKKDASRLIIQTLMQKPETEKSSKKTINSAEQTNFFLNYIENISSFVSQNELSRAKRFTASTAADFEKNPVDYMKKLSEFWIISPFIKTGDDFSTIKLPAENQNRANLVRLEDLQKKLNAETPFVFVFINSKDFKANKKEYLKAGFEEINETNSSWYLQDFFKKTENQYKVENFTAKTNPDSADNSYFEKNHSEIRQRKLKNGINVFSKKNENEFGAVLTISINGGQLNSAKNNGFEEVMCNIAANLIQTELYKTQAKGIICNDFQISVKSDLQTCAIFIEFHKDDSYAVCDSIKNALVFAEIPPAVADKAVAARQYKKRLENGSATKQAESAVIKSLYGQNDFYNIFETQNDVLQNTNYVSILQAYPNLLDASRYNVIICGDFDENIFEYLEESFSYFSNLNAKLNDCDDLPDFQKNKSIFVKINHTFLTDVPAELAGPQPAVLIPTTEFLDPAIYAIASPKNGTKESAIFNATLNFFRKEFEKNLSQKAKTANNKVKVEFAKSKMEFALITITDVKYSKEIDSAYKLTRENLAKKLNSAEANDLISEIKNLWTLNQMKETKTNLGTSKLLQKGIEYFREYPAPDFYLLEYNFIQNAQIQDFIRIMDFIPLTPQLRAYGAKS